MFVPLIIHNIAFILKIQFYVSLIKKHYSYYSLIYKYMLKTIDSGNSAHYIYY